MTLADVVFANALEPTTDPVALAKAHASLTDLAGVPIERQLFAALNREDAHCAAEVVGPTGSGKSSCIMRVVSDISALAQSPHEVLLLSAGDAESTLGDQAEFAYYLVDLLRSQGFRFSTEIQDQLAQVQPAETLVKDPVITHTGKLEGGLPVARASYQGALEEAHTERTFGKNPAQARQDLEDILKVMRQHGARPVVVIDDTDRFVDPSDGTREHEATVDALFNNAVRLLDQLRLDFVVAVHPRFRGTSGYEMATTKLLRTRLNIPFLEHTEDMNPIGKVLNKHLRAHEIDTPVDEMMSVQAGASLYGAYATNGQDIRDVLAIAQQAATRAQDAEASRIEAQHVAAAMRELESSGS
jgi:hypothetical protein